MAVKTRVTEVQVFRSGATVTRCGEVSLTAGRNVVYISGMTNSTVFDSYKLKFPEKVRAVNIQIVSDPLPDGDEKKESEVIAKQLDEIAYQIETTDMMIELRKKNSDFANRSNISVEEQEKILSALPQQILMLHKQRDELVEKQTNLTEEYNKAVEEEKKPVIIAELSSEEAGTVPFILQYQEKDSCWVPQYEIQYRDDRSPLDVSMKAQIRQNSGEDWKQVKVTLYTGNPSVSKDLPVIAPIELSIYEPPKDRAAKGIMPMDMMLGAAAGAAMESSANMMMGAAMDVAALKMDTAEVSEEETMTAFILPNLRDILTDTDGNMADLQSFKVNAVYNVLSVPSVDNKCYLTAEVVAADWPLPPADASVYIRDTFAGTVYVDAAADTEKILLSLGQDERLTVVRTEAPKKLQDVFLKNLRRSTSKISIKLVNNSSEAVNTLVIDQIPVSTDKVIVVDPVQLSDGIVDDETGEVKWNLLAEPGKTVVYELEYNVSWPKDKRMGEHRKNVVRRTATVSSGSQFCHTCGARMSGKFCPECGAPAN